MNITNVRPQPGGGGILALFDIEVAQDFRLLNWTLKRASDGVWTSYPPTAKSGTPSAKAPLHVREQITAAAVATLNGGRSAHERTNAA